MATAPVTSLASRLDLKGTTAVIERATLYVGTDTGVSHLAAATGTPSVVIFGPTNPERYAPRGRAVEILAPEASRRLPDIDLRKSQRSSHRPRTTEITVEVVTHAIDRLLPAAGTED